MKNNKTGQMKPILVTKSDSSSPSSRADCVVARELPFCLLGTHARLLGEDCKI